MTVLSKLRRLFLDDNVVWNTAVYVQDAPFSLDLNFREPRLLLRCRRLKLFGSHPHTCADPFLFVHGGHLYIFYEKVFPRQPGLICALATKDLEHFEDLGEILREPYHLSYPFVFHDELGHIFMVPEASRFGVTSLYGFKSFPYGVFKIRDLLKGNFYDTNVIKKDDQWFIFTTSPEGLHIFFTNDLIGGEVHAHPLNPLTTNPRYSRNGGGPIRLGPRLLRFAQDCSESYGRNIHIFEIEELSTDRYRESLIRENAVCLTEPWRRLGSHHVSVAEFLGKTVVCIDGKEPDLYVNRFLAPFGRLGRMIHARSPLVLPG